MKSDKRRRSALGTGTTVGKYERKKKRNGDEGVTSAPAPQTEIIK